MEAAAVNRAAALIARARVRRGLVGPLPQSCRPAVESDAYAIQDAVHNRLAAAGRGALAGWKLGCTTPVMQTLLDFPSPAYGGMVAEGIHLGNHRFRHAHFRRPGVECEIAVRIQSNLLPERAPFDRRSVEEVVDACMIAAEVVDDRYTDFGTIGGPTLIADDFFHAAAVLGQPLRDWRTLDLESLEGRTFVDGKEVGRGSVGDVMGHPFEALAWLSNQLATRNRSLRAGELVLTGSVVATQWIEPGGEVEVEVDALGRLEVGFD